MSRVARPAQVLKCALAAEIANVRSELTRALLSLSLTPSLPSVVSAGISSGISDSSFMLPSPLEPLELDQHAHSGKQASCNGQQLIDALGASFPAALHHVGVPFSVSNLSRKNVFIKRDDAIHPILSGNKLRKVEPHLAAMRLAGCSNLVCFGGAHSNLLHAVAFAAKLLGLPCTAIVRGEELDVPDHKRAQVWSPTLQFAAACGTQLKFMSRETYDAFTAHLRKASWEDERAGTDDAIHRQTSEACPGIDLHGSYVLPEGAGGVLGAVGSTSIIDELSTQLPGFASTPTTVVAACGTGTTMVGLLAGAAAHKASNIRIMGVSALKTAAYEVNDALPWAMPPTGTQVEWSIQQGFHFGGFARYPRVLRRFVEAWEGATGVPLDPVYTSKAALAMLAHLDTTAQMVLLHSGGLQGRRTHHVAA